MQQKYKVYLNSHLIILLLSKDFYKQKPGCKLFFNKPSNKKVNEIINFLFQDEKAKVLCFHSTNLEEMWQDFISIFDVIHAGGGLVKNINEDYLFIYRNDKWDLPKGKLDPGETIEQCAVREVEEECGINNLILGDKIKNTYHIYKYKGNNVLKYTHWFQMEYRGDESLVPQLEEGITHVEWISANELEKVKRNTYGNIMEVI